MAGFVAFRRDTLLSLEDCLLALQPSISYLTRSILHLCQQRDEISRAHGMDGDRPKDERFRRSSISVLHIDWALLHKRCGGVISCIQRGSWDA